MKWYNESKGYGFISVASAEDDIFFHVSGVHDSTISPQEGQKVLFEKVLGRKGINAKNIRYLVGGENEESELSEDYSNTVTITPGKNSFLNINHFTDEEKKIINGLSRYFYITNGGGAIHLGVASEYRYFLMKPINKYQEMFNLNREIIVIFSPYSIFQPRTLDAIDVAYKKHTRLRIDRICSVVISKDTNMETKLYEILSKDTEMQIIIPFSYSELINEFSEGFVINRIKKHFYERDLFEFEAPIKNNYTFW